jgi:hypothetical protein
VDIICTSSAHHLHIICISSALDNADEVLEICCRLPVEFYIMGSKQAGSIGKNTRKQGGI